MRILLIVMSMLLVLSCNNPKRTNPFDVAGENWHPPLIVAMADTNVSIYDTMVIHAQGIDSNGTVSKYFWALDGVNYRDSTDSGRVKCVFTTAGIKNVQVKVRDNDGVYSLKSDTVKITVHSYAPTVIAMNDTTVAINDSFFVHATATDTNGTIKKYLWALDGVNYTDSTDSDRVKTAFGSFGIKKVRVKVIDDDGIVSPVDSIVVTVKDNAPVNLSPVDSAKIIVTMPTLRWIPGMYHSTFRVLLDTISPPVAIAGTDITDSQYTPTASLNYEITYYWQVIGINASSAEAPGQVWEFTPSIDGIVAYYPFNGNANDKSGNGYNGIVYGAILTIDRFGNAGNAYSFNGISDSIILPLTQTGITSYSMSAWFKTDSGGTIIDGGGQFGTTAIDLWIHNVHTCPTACLHTIGYCADGQGISIGKLTTNPFTDNQWHHVVGVWNGAAGSILPSQFNIYVDGVLVQQTTGAVGASIAPIYGYNQILIGKHRTPWNSFFNGALDDIRIYNRALSNTEVLALYHERGW